MAVPSRMHRCGGWCLAALAAVVAALMVAAPPASASYPSNVIHLYDSTFEHDTQASTGQTTGVWFVLFTASTMKSHAMAHAIWNELAEDEDKELIYAQVDFDDRTNCKALASRFTELQPPVGVLFRDRKMYIYDGPLRDASALQDIQDFVRSGYESATPLEVPSVEGPNTSLKKLADEQAKGVDWKRVGLGLSCLAVGACFRAYVWFQKKKQEEEAARTAAEAEGAAGQPRAQAAPGAKAAVAGAKAAVAAAAADAGNDGDDDGEPAAGARRRTRRAA